MAAKMQSEEKQLIFMPGPGIGHIVSAVDVGKLIVSRDIRLSITFFLINDAEVRKYTHSQHLHANPRLRFLNLPELESEPPPPHVSEHINRHKPLVREAVLDIRKMKTPVAGFIVDMFCVNMLDVANEFGIPTYTFFTSSAAFLSLMLFIQRFADEDGQDITEYKDSDREFVVPGFTNPVPVKVLPSPMLDKNGGSELVVFTARMIQQTRGIFINTFQELEPTVVDSLSESNCKIPPIYPVGPLLNFNTESESNYNEIMTWLDQQPPASVIFLCFGSKGSFSEAQIKHLAEALESSGCRFLWSLRTRKTTNNTSPDDILPKGFSERNSGVGKVIGWAPQAAVLSHAAVGGFVSHCGWNSILESFWFGVPIAAWPIYAEQQVNAFQMVVELGMAVEIRMDYRDDDEIVVSAEDIGRAIKRLMVDEEGNGMREKVKDVREKSSRALMDGGSSHRFLGSLIHDILHNSLA